MIKLIEFVIIAFFFNILYRILLRRKQTKKSLKNITDFSFLKIWTAQELDKEIHNLEQRILEPTENSKKTIIYTYKF